MILNGDGGIKVKSACTLTELLVLDKKPIDSDTL